jgi:hypothetical protein
MRGEYTLEQQKAARFRMLEKFYKESGGTEDAIYDFAEIGEVLQLPSELNTITYNYLVKEGLLKSVGIGGGVDITHSGIVQYEKAVSTPDKATEYFLPVNVINNYINIEKNEKSPIQFGNINSQQTINKKNDYGDIRSWIQSVEEALKKEKEDGILEKIQDDILLIKTNMDSDKPNNKYIGIALRAIEGVLTGITSNVIFHELATRLPSLIP